ncbi:Hypothetical protein PHPALM_615 [Phytophthora palmivora]|uniref:Uncharacterized protein n=1 Tax=Phytophthora palmivora TaxID=4796 RepID=A0A2P4YUF1_9STRA|nr:Hypothetical protein PHPALM_615 [Phytophthora palmivora]
MFTDGSFWAFYQCIVLMVSDAASGAIVPVYYLLTTGKALAIYRKMMNLINESTERRLRPANIACDFEQAPIGTITSQFGNARSIGCMFHFK